MWSVKDVYYISGSTGILAANYGQALICQFPGITFNEKTFPFINSVAQAKETMQKILEYAGGRRPLVFTSLVDPQIRDIFDSTEVEFIDIFEHRLTYLENILECKALRIAGSSRQTDAVVLKERVEAIHFCLEHDDGLKTHQYNQADVIILGVSRSGKTPVSVYLATQTGLKAANFPLTSEYLQTYILPNNILGNRMKMIGLTTSPQFLSNIREKRYPGSKYSSLATCREEIKQAEQIYQRYKIPWLLSTGQSIEEVATQIIQKLNLATIKRFA
ncbi:MAG: pyruvate, phosphate dikinase/phosphoenolpyruvate synthase regulator [Desulfobulbaceae bacterium]|uniref:Pyruvate, phosphate dikinase/phosphoenolpyruvate synthase regulator n=1 Tax=Candidatus Desulfobia pelagia TaxID=2841692 RepID=A0A8J6NEU4_9BACT|nr:pyruvate, phosphate dikinase/phosphoenolpyruvate synthase regulator [Candidatus Desulfobia pelagia]